jgi:surface protein
MADGLKLNLKEVGVLKNTEGTFHEIKGKNNSGANFSWRSPIALTIDGSINTNVSNFYVHSSNNSGQNADILVDWGDGSETIITTHGTTNLSHSYPTATANYDLVIYPLTRYSNYYVQTFLSSIIEVKSFGSVTDEQFSGVTSSSSIGSTNLVSVPKSISPKIKSLEELLLVSASGDTFNDINVTYWDVSGVDNFFVAFAGRDAFNRDVSVWDISQATNLRSMFANAISFNQNISPWNTSNVIQMQTVFSGASSFNQNLGSWSIKNVTGMSGMFNNSGMSTENYSRTLIGWANSHYSGNAKNNVSLGATSITYNSTAYTTGNQFNDAVSARAYLVGTAGWTITDGGAV